MPANRHTTLTYLASLRGLLLVCSLLLACQVTLASTRLDDSSAAQDLYGRVDFLVDPQSALSLDDVRAVDAPFQPSMNRRDLSFGYVPGVIWLRLALQSADPR